MKIQISFAILFTIIINKVKNVSASVGDRSQYFVNCVKGCRSNNCTDDGHSFKSEDDRVFLNELLLWSCHDECVYGCMWRTTNLFVAREWNVPQFYGKWPFKRFMGVQEPASAVFSFFNLLVHWNMLKIFRREVRSDSPMYYIWNVFSLICMNGWICSIIFHTRDFPLTELLDYGFAYSMVLANFTCMILRFIYRSPFIFKALVSLISIAFFVNHFTYLSIGRFDYSYNMKANIVTGVLTGIGWILWYLFQRKNKPYAWKILLFQILVGISLLLEVNDFPPLFWTFDAHSLWHLSTVFPSMLLYSFLIDDTNQLRNEKYLNSESEDEKEKLI